NSRGERARSCAPSRTPNLLFFADLNFCVSSIVHIGARRTATLHAHGFYSLLGAARLDAAHANDDPRPGHVSVPSGSERMGKPPYRLGISRVSRCLAKEPSTVRNGSRLCVRYCWRRFSARLIARDRVSTTAR